MIVHYFKDQLTREEAVNTTPCKTIKFEDPVKVLSVGKNVFSENKFKTGYSVNHNGKKELFWEWSERRNMMVGQAFKDSEGRVVT